MGYTSTALNSALTSSFCPKYVKENLNDIFADWKHEAIPMSYEGVGHLEVLESKSSADFNNVPSMTLRPVYWRKVLYDCCCNFCGRKVSCS